MTIRRGEPWGAPCVLGPDTPIADDDAALAALAIAMRAAGTPVPEVAVRAGDLARTMGGASPGRVVVGAVLVRAPVDLVRVVADGGAPAWCCAHVVLRRSWWRGGVVVAANAEYLSGRDVAPRAHPNDGRLDVLQVAPSMSVRTRLRAWHRARAGTHVPHPEISTMQTATMTMEFERRVGIWLDGRRWATARCVQLDVEPDAVVVLA